MKLSTITIPSIEVTNVEHKILWNTLPNQRRVLGAKVIHWDTSDGNNLIRLDGENIYRQVVVTS